MSNIATLLLITMLTFELWHDLRRYRIYSASLLSVILIYIFYCFLIEALDITWHIVALPGLSEDFIYQNLIVISVFSLAFAGGKRLCYMALLTLLPLPENNLAIRMNSTFPSDPYVDSVSIYGPLILGVTLFAINLDGWWIFDPYPWNIGKYSLIELQGADVLAVIFVSLASYRSVLLLRGRIIVRSVLTIMCLQYVLAGERASLLFILCGMYLIRMIRTNLSLSRKISEIGILTIVLLASLELISQIRGQTDAEYGSFITELDLVPYGLSHMVYGIQLSDYGGSNVLGGAPAFLGTLILQIIPSPILLYFGHETYNGPWLLASHVSNPGGFFIPAELYFLGGIWMVCIIALYIGIWAAISDYVFMKSIIDKRHIVAIVVIIASVSNGYALFYGIQTLNRMMTLPLIFYGLTVFFSRRLIVGRSAQNRRARSWEG